MASAFQLPGLLSAVVGGGSTPPAVPVNTVAPAITGTPQVGSVLTASPGTWTNSPTGYAYQWQAAGSNVGTNTNTYTPVSGDVGKTITVTVTASNTSGSGAPAISSATAAVTAAAPVLPATGNMVFKLAASDLATQQPGIADGDPVGSWTETQNNVAFTGSGTNRPVYKPTIMNGFPGVQATAASVQYLTALHASAAALAATIDTKQYTVMIVSKHTVQTGTGTPMFGTSAPGNTFTFIGDGKNLGRNGTTFVQAPISASATKVWTQVYTTDNTNYQQGAPAGLQTIAVDGGIVHGVLGPGPNSGTGDWTLFAAPGGSTPSSAIIGDIIVWNRRLLPAEILQVQLWVNAKYGLTAAWAGKSSFKVFDGDSQVMGTGMSVAGGSFAYLTAQNLGLTYGQFTNVAIGGAIVQDITALAPTYVDTLSALTGIPTDLAVLCFYNSNNPGRTGATPGAAAASAFGTYITARRNAGVRKIALGTFVDTTTTAISNNMAAYLTGVQALSPDALVNLHNDANIGVSGGFPGGTPGVNAANTTYFVNDGIHLKTPGQTIQAGLFSTAMTGW